MAYSFLEMLEKTPEKNIVLLHCDYVGPMRGMIGEMVVGEMFDGVHDVHACEKPEEISSLADAHNVGVILMRVRTRQSIDSAQRDINELREVQATHPHVPIIAYAQHPSVVSRAAENSGVELHATLHANTMSASHLIEAVRDAVYLVSPQQPGGLVA